MRQTNIIIAEFETAADDRKREIELEVQLDIRQLLKSISEESEIVSQAISKLAKIS